MPIHTGDTLFQTQYKYIWIKKDKCKTLKFVILSFTNKILCMSKKLFKTTTVHFMQFHSSWLIPLFTNEDNYPNDHH